MSRLFDIAGNIMLVLYAAIIPVEIIAFCYICYLHFVG